MDRHRADRKHSEARRVIGDLCHVLGVNFDDVERIEIAPGRIQVTLGGVSVVKDGTDAVRTYSIPYF